jgi:4-hydroxy-L-threonine phosphate dehydrogenase PdxA
MKPRIALLLGDPAGIGPELIARLLARKENRERAELLLIADRRELDEGMRIAGEDFEYAVATDARTADFSGDMPVLIDFRLADDAPYVRAQASERGGRYSLEVFKLGLELTQANVTQALLFAPLNKSSLHLAGMHQRDELEWFAQQLGHHGSFGEFNVLDELWTSRVTSHIALKDVSRTLSIERIIDSIALLDEGLQRSGIAKPRLAVCGFNPHNGDNGAFGREELDVIGPAVEMARMRGYAVEGPYPADTIFVRALQHRTLDGVVTMYHDQGQIAMKLLGFWRGASVHGGLPIPVTTPAHGTAFDIQGLGRADVGATQKAFDIACRMAAQRL